jgi:molybdopterin converting factor small subunit
MPEVTVRYFAAAGAAAGLPEERVQVPDGSSVGSLLRWLQERHGEGLTRVMGRCSYLLDETAVRDLDRALGPDSTLDVLPPFAGG